MTQRILRVAVALVTFGAGAAAATVFNAVFGSSPVVSRPNYASPAPYRTGCSKMKSWRSRSESVPMPPPAAVVPDVAPLPDAPPPPPRPVVKKRITIKLPDGTVRVIESGAESVGQKQ